VTNCHALKLTSSDGKKYATDCANTEIMFRIIQSIPSPKAEPFKVWLAKVGYERVKEIEDPELAQQRMKKLYEQKGYSKDWIDKRIRGISIRQNLTAEWKERGVSYEKDFAILTSEISKASFGMTPMEYKKHKNHNLRDHMTDFELIFSMLGEKVTTEISKQEKPDNFDKNKKVARRGVGVAQNARLSTEEELGRSVISQDNFLKQENREEIEEEA
jgi:DNA-damage-inducible protein D